MTREFNMQSQRKLILHLLFAASGAAALIYEVLWLRAFANLFGATAEAVAATLAAVFLGLALGADRFGRLADRTTRPLRLYAWLEVGVAIAALPVLPALGLYGWIYDDLYRFFGPTPALFTGVKTVLAALVLLPATAFMGGTLPALGRALIADAGPLGRQGGRLYALNIIGAVVGSLLATFGLTLWLGVRGSYALAIALSLAIAAAAGWLSRSELPLEPAILTPSSGSPGPRQSGSRRLLVIAFASGFATIGLELLWTRMLALVLQNSVYSFGSVVTVFLMGLAVGAALVARLLRHFSAWRILRVSLLLTALLVFLTPAEFEFLTGGLKLHLGPGGWATYSASIVGLAAAVILPPIITAGMTLPCIWELWRDSPGSGSRLGRPTALNTVGAIAGPLVAGFITLPWLGLGASVAAIGGLYILMGEMVPPGARRLKYGGWERAAVYPAVLGVLLFLPPSGLPVARIEEGERLIWAREGARGAVAVVDRDGDRRIKLDNHYAIGGSRLALEERRQGHLPLLLHRDPRSIAFIGMGTGITAGAALAHRQVERIVVMELVPEIVEAARDNFRTWNRGLVDERRVEIVVEDGRNHLAGTSERFDVIVGDLFVPWRQGVGSLYAREHFERVRSRLAPGGIFAQWLPLWQLSRLEFDIISATFLSVFEHVTLWRGVFNPAAPSVALVAHRDGQAFDLDAVANRLAELRVREGADRDGFLTEITGFMVLYAGSLSSKADGLGRAGLNTDDRPRIEWLAPRTQLAVQSGEAQWFIGVELADFYDELNQRLGTSGDQLLHARGHEPSNYRLAAADFFRAEVLAARGLSSQAESLRQRAFQRLRAP